MHVIFPKKQMNTYKWDCIFIFYSGDLHYRDSQDAVWTLEIGLIHAVRNGFSLHGNQFGKNETLAEILRPHPRNLSLRKTAFVHVYTFSWSSGTLISENTLIGNGNNIFVLGNQYLGFLFIYFFWVCAGWVNQSWSIYLIWCWLIAALL